MNPKHTDSGKLQLSFLGQIEGISATAIAEQNTAAAAHRTILAARVDGNIRGARPLDPGLDGEILQLQNRRIAQIDSVAMRSVEDKSLSSHSRPIPDDSRSRDLSIQPAEFI